MNDAVINEYSSDYSDDEYNDDENISGISLKVDYYVNNSDHYSCNGEDRFFNDTKIDNGYMETPEQRTWIFDKIKCCCDISAVDYNKLFMFSTHKMKEIINLSNMVFLLDPAFLYIENYDLKNMMPMSAYCRDINNYGASERAERAKNIRLDQLVEHYPVRSSDITFESENLDIALNKILSTKYMNSQLNRLMASNSMQAGGICRVFNDRVIETIKHTVQQKDKNDLTVVYVYSSETVGLEVSSEAGYPIGRLEKYDGKITNIFQYCNYPIPKLTENAGDTEFEFDIPLWSTIKYISLPYVYSEKEEIDNILKKCTNNEVVSLNSDDYFIIFKWIYTVLKVKIENKKYKLSVNMTAHEKVKRLFNGYGKNNADKILDAIFKHFIGIIETMFKDVLFNSKQSLQFGNELIRTGFAMNLYSLSKTADEIYFWFKYSKGCENNDFEQFELIDFNDKAFEFTPIKSNSVVPDFDSDEDFKANDYFFMDKKIYRMFMEQLYDSINTDSLFATVVNEVNNNSKTYFQQSNNDYLYPIDSIRKSLIIACNKLEDSDFYNKLSVWSY